MWLTGKVIRSGVAAAFVFAGGVFVFCATPAQTLNLASNAVVLTDDEEDSAVTARVARISFIRGEAQVKRAGSDEWEKATLNLPLVEGDEIVTDNDSRIEIQFDTTKHLRLNENAYLKITGLKDEGIVVSLSLGTLSLHVTSFDKDRFFFEIDAPKTTVAIQRSGTYRIDAGREGDREIRITSSGGGEARVYADNLGFVLKNNRSALVFIDGDRAGEWESAEASRFTDWFDEWADDRDKVIAKRLRDAHYDQYYDRDIYAADDLDEYGAWVHTRDYGYVWRPYRRSIDHYADWSPYRYGHWRWMSPFGWIWVNDEPWGWATYHHGRWVYYGGYWNWSPYGHYRYARSWWRPALVVINIFNNNVCWYPLPYHYGYYNYNGYYGGGHHGGGHNNVLPPINHGGIKPIPPVRSPIRINPNALAADVVPPSGVVAVPVNNFATSIKNIRKASPAIAKAVLAVKPADIEPTPLNAVAVKSRKAPEIVADPPSVKSIPSRVGAAVRKNDVPLDDELRTTRVFGGRAPVAPSETSPTNSGSPRKTGAVERSPIRPTEPNTPVRQPVDIQPPRVKNEDTDPPVRVPPSDPQPVKPPPVRSVPRTESEPVRQPPPRNDPPVRQPPPRSDPPPVKQPSRSDSPPTKSEPKAPRKTDSDG